MYSKLFENLKTTIARERLLAVSTFVVMTLTFLVLGLFLGVVVLTQTGIRQLEEQAQVTVFFKDDYPEANILDLQTKAKTDSRVLDVTYVSKEQAFSIFSEINKNEPLLLESISASILPASLEIKTKRLGDLSAIAGEFEKVDGVEEIKYFRDVVEKFKFWSTVTYVVGATLVLAFFVVSYAVIVATLHAVIDSKGVEYEILKLVGASDTYVKEPLIFQGVVFGLISAVVASVVLFLVYTLVAFKFLGFSQVLLFGFIPYKINTLVFSGMLGAVLIASGGVLGYFGSLNALKRYLKY